jgi:protein-S-isoprenylcysteine O-methyltransferase Ste14
MGLVLFAAAGTMNWPAAWVFLGLMVIVSLTAGATMGRRDPGLMRERMSSPIQKDQPLADKILLTILLLGMFAWLGFMGLDAVRFRWSSVPVWVQALGALVILLSIWMNVRIFRENSFAAPVVKAQKERGQRVIDTGPYAIVRHPMYVAGVVYFAGVALLLGSLWGLVLVSFFAVLLIIRIGIEERTLRTELEGYDDYARRVPYRLIPGVW